MLNAKRLFALTLTLTIAACSSSGGGRLDYKEAKSLSGLDVPPDLVVPVNTGDTELPMVGGTATPGAVLPQSEVVRVVRDGSERWLEVDASVETLWPRLRSFWGSLGLEVAMDKAELGIMETAWAENRADAPSGFLTDMVKSVFKNAYSAGTRDKYRLRLERGEQGGSEIYVSHYGLKEIAIATRDEIESGNIRWEVRPSDQELVNEVLKRLVVFLGGTKAAAAQLAAVEAEEQERVRRSGEELVLNEGFARSWRRTGIALDRIGLVVEDRNRSQGIYYISQIDLVEEEEKAGWLSSLFSSKDDTDDTQQELLQVRLRAEGDTTRLSIADPDSSKPREKLMRELTERLYQELK